jgi:hypothetical protein
VHCSPVAFLASLPFALVGCSLTGSAEGPPPSPYCRGGDPLAGVYHPQRLELKARCRVASGVVTRVTFEAYDGDVHVRLRLDAPDRGLLSQGNEQLGGDLVVEVIPQDRSRVPIPETGSRVTAVGPWVNDTAHGWMEIHPAWAMSGGRILPASPFELRRAQLLLADVSEADVED